MVTEKTKVEKPVKTVEAKDNTKKSCVVKELTMKSPRLVGPVCQN